MKTFYKYAAFAAAALAGLCACSSDDDAAETGLRPATRRTAADHRQRPDDHRIHPPLGSRRRRRVLRLHVRRRERDIDDRLPAGIQQSGTAERVCRGGQGLPPGPGRIHRIPLHLHPRADRRSGAASPAEDHARQRLCVENRHLLDRSARSGTLRVLGRRRGGVDHPKPYGHPVETRQGPHLLLLGARHDVRRHALHQLGSRTALVRHLGRRRSAAGHRPDDDHLRRRGVRHLRLQRRNLLL